MESTDAQFLEEIGLTQGEAKVYLALLETGTSATGQIAKQAQVHTSKVYPILDRLLQKGLATFIISNGVRHYSASDPQQLMAFMDEKRRTLEEQERQAAQRIPQLILRQKMQGAHQSAAVFEGIKGIQTLFETMLDEWNPEEGYLVFSPGDEYMGEELNRFFLKHHLNRIEHGVTVKVIALKSQRGYYTKKYRGVKNMIFKYTDHALPAGINIVHNKVSTLIWRPIPSAFVIESPYVAKEYREFFKRVWDDAEE